MTSAKRVRAQVAGGYVRKTVSLPASLVEQVNASLEPGETISLFMTMAAAHHLNRLERIRNKKRKS
ncbi:MAG: hypothetical protein EPN91_00275 [Salinibacterium sp.]|nr:MAG: hypothetical protein EPN91_00275 [Salinibacterium sp.]